MPAAVVSFIGSNLVAIGSALGAGAASAGVAMAVGAAAVVAGAVAAQKLISELYSVPNIDSDRSRQATVRGTVEPQKLIYGEALVSGPISFVGVAGTDNRDLYHAIVLAGHPSDSISDIYFDDERIQSAHINASGNVTTGTFGPKDGTTICVIRKLTGSQTTADSVLDGAFSTINSSEHIGTNLTYIVTKFTLTDKSQETWDKFLPNDIKALVKGKKVYDPRQDSTSTYYDANVGVGTQRSNDSTTWEWSENPVWCLVDYLTDDRFGMDIDLDRIDLSKAVDAADICDATVSVPGGSEKRYTCNGVVFGTSTHKTNINKLLSSMNGMLTYTNGKYVIRAGAFEAVGTGMTLTEDHMTGPVRLKTSFERNERFNTITGTFIDPSKNYKEIEFPKVQITSALTRDNNEELTRELKLSMTNSRYMAQRIAHKLIQLSDLQKVLTFPTNLAGVNISVGDRVNVTLSEFGYTNKTFVCLGWTLSESGSGGVNLTLREDDSSSYADLGSSGYSTVTPAGGIQQGFFGVPDPSGLSATAHVESIELDWTNPANMTGIIAIEVFASPNSSWSSAVKIGETIGTQFIHDESNGVDSIVEGDQRYYWVRARRFPSGEGTDAVSDRNPDSDTSTVQATKGALGDLASQDTVGDGQIDDNAVGTDQIEDGAVDTDQIADDAVTVDKIANTLESTNYVAGTSGWRLTTAGDFEAGDGDFRGTVKATVLDVEDANVHGTLTATNIAAGIVTADTLAADVFAEFDDRYGGSGGFYRADNDEFFDGSATKYVTLPTVTHDNSKSIRFQCNLVHAWGTTSGYGGTNGLKLRVTFEYSTDDTTYAKVPGSGENSNDYYERSATATIYSVTSAFDLAVDIRYEMTGSSLSDNTAYYFRVKIEYVSATNAFTSAAAGSANGVPIKFNVQQTAGLTAAAGDADTVDGLQASQFLRSDTSDTFSGNLTVTGNLTVQGSQTQLDTQTLTVEDNNIVLNYSTGDSSGSADNSGITIQDAVNSSTDASLLWKATGDYFQFSHPINAISSASNAYAAEFRGAPQPQGPSGMVSNGVKITAGSASTDTVLLVQELDNTAILTINGFGQTTFANSVTIDGQSVTGTKIGQWNTAYTYSQVGHLPLAGGTMTGTLNMGANAISSTGTISSGAITSSDLIKTTSAKGFMVDSTVDLSMSYYTQVPSTSWSIFTTNNHADTILSTNLKVDANHDVVVNQTHSNIKGSGIVFTGNGHSAGENAIAFYAFGDNDGGTAGDVINEEDWAAKLTGSGFEIDGTVKFSSNNHYFEAGTNSVDLKNASNVVLGGFNASGVNSPFGYQINGTTVINSSRNLVNIGTISSGDITTTGTVLINDSLGGNSTSAMGNFDRLEFSNSFSDVMRGPNKILMYNSGGWVGGFGIADDLVTYSSGGSHVFYSSQNTTTYDERFRIDDSGDITVNRMIIARSNSGVSAPSNADHTLGTRIKFFDGSSADWYAQGIESSNMWFNTAGGFKWYNDSSIQMTLSADRLGIATTPHATDKLRVGGNISQSAGSIFAFGDLVIGQGALKQGTTTLIDSSRNLTNIGTYTGAGDVVAQAANILFHARSSADGQTVGFRAGYQNHTTLQAFFRYTTGDAQLYIDNDFTGNNSTYSNINFRNKANNGASLINRMTIHGSTGHVNITGGALQMGGTTVIDSSRNLTNIGTISSGAITSSGTIVQYESYNDASKLLGSKLITDAGSTSYTHPYLDMRRWTGVSSDHYAGSIEVAPTNTDAASIVFYSDTVSTNTKASTERFRIHSNGDVRIASGSLQMATTTVIASTRRFYASDGTVSKAAYSFDGESSTGMYKYGTNQIGFTVGGTLKAYIQDSTYSLVVSGKISSTGGNSDNWNTAYGWGDHSTAGYLQTNDNITVGTISSGAITSTGNITGAALIIDGNTAVDKSGNYMVFYDGSGSAALYAGNTSDNRNYYQANAHRWRSDDASTNFAELSSSGLRIGSAVGPSEMLHVSGNIRADGVFIVNGTTVIDSSRNLTNIAAITSTGNMSLTGELDITKSGSTHSLLLGNRDNFADSSSDSLIWITSGSGTFKYGQGAHLVFEGRRSTRNFYFKVGNVTAPQHIMHYNGYVGFGTGDITPTDRVHVDGTVRASSYKVGTTTVIDSGRNLTNIGTISSGAITSSGTGSFTSNVTANGVTIGASDVRSSSNILTLGGTSEVVRIHSGNFDVTSGSLHVGGTTVIDSSRYLRNVYAARGASGLRFEINDWFYDSSGTQSRFYFEGSGRTFFGSGNGYIFRDSANTGRATISNYGGVNLLSGGDGQVGSTVALAVGGTTTIDSSRNVFGVNGSFTGYAAIGSRIGTISPSLSVVGATNSVPFLAKSGSYSTVFSVLPWSDAITYLASGTYYQGGSWVHASPNDYECLLGISGNTGGRWYVTSNGVGGSWNHANNVQLWNNSGVWTSGVNTGGAITSGGAVTAGNGSTSLGYYVGTTQVIQGSTRNLVNIGTITAGLTKLTPSGWNAPPTHAALNIGYSGSGETRAIDIDGGWSNGESKSITFTHGSSATNMVGQINVAHKPSSNTAGSSIRWGKLYHSGDSSLYTMELHSESTAYAYLDINRTMVNIGQDSTYGAGYGVIGFGGRSNGYNRVFGRTGTQDGLFLASATGHGIYMRPNGSDVTKLTVAAGGQVEITQGDITLDQDGTYGAGYGTIGFGGTSNGYNRVFARNSTADGLYLAAATGAKVKVRANGSSADTLIFGYDDSYSGYASLGFGGALQNGYNRIFASTGNSDGMYITAATGRGIFFRVNGNGNNVFQIKSDGGLYVGASGGTLVLDQSRNLTNIGTISSGFIAASGYRVGDDYAIMKFQTPYFTHGTSNLACDLILGNDYINTVLEVEITGGYSNQNTTGLLRRRWYVGLNPNGSIWQTPTVIDETMEGHIVSHLFVSDPFWDSSASTYKIRIYKKNSNGNSYRVLIKYLSNDAADQLATNAGMSGLLTNTSTTSSHSAGTNATSGYRVGGTLVFDSNKRMLVSDGSASAPYMTFAADTNTGFYRPAADNIGFAIGGVARAFMSGTQFNMTGNGVFSGSLSVGGATVIDTSRNLISANITNQGTMSSGSTTLTANYTGGSGDYTNIGNPPLKIVTSSGYARVPVVSAHSSISIVHNFETAKDVYWGEPNDTGVYYFRGRNFYINNGNTGIGVTPNSSYKLYVGGNIAQSSGSIYAFGDVVIGQGGLKRGSTTLIDASRNLTNIGTYTGAGDVVAQAANVLFHARSSADGQTVGFRAGYTNHTTLQAFFRYTTGDAQLYIDNDFTGNNGVYSNINFRNKANNGTSLVNRLTIHGSTGNVNITGGNLQMSGTTVIDASRNGVFVNLRADGGNLIMGDEAYIASSSYVGMKTSRMSGSNDYMILSGTTDGNTYVSAQDTQSVKIRGGGNNSGNQIEVPDGSTITATTSNFYCTGNVTAYYSSDESLKENIRVIENPIEKIKQIRGVYFDWTDDYIKEQSNDGEIDIRKDDVGVIAQDVQPVLDEVVTTRNDGTLAVRYEKMIALCIEAIKEQQDQIDSLKDIIKEMTDGNN